MMPTVSHLVIWFCWWARRYRRLGLEAVAGMFAGLVAHGWQGRRENNAPELCGALSAFCRAYSIDVDARNPSGRAIAAMGVSEGWVGAEFLGYAVGDAVDGAPRHGEEHAGECRLNLPATNMLDALLRAAVWARIDAEPAEQSTDDLEWVDRIAAIVADEAREMWARAESVERVTQDDFRYQWLPSQRTHAASRFVAGLRTPESYPVELNVCRCGHLEAPTHLSAGGFCRVHKCKCDGFVLAVEAKAALGVPSSGAENETCVCGHQRRPTHDTPGGECGVFACNCAGFVALGDVTGGAL